MCLVAFCGALVAMPATATAQDVVYERLRVQGGFTHEDRGAQASLDDVWLGATPELAAVFARPRTFSQLTYTLTGMIHTELPAEIANRLTLGVSHEISKTTLVFASAEAFQTSLRNLLTSRPAAATELAALAAPEGTFLGVRATEGLSWEAGPRVRIGQGLDAAMVTSIDSGPTKNYLANASFSADRVWQFDALGVEARGGYASNQVTTRINQKLVTTSLGPRWRHDFNARLSTFVTVGGMLILSPDPGTGIVLASTARGSLLYALSSARLDLSAASGAEPNILTGQILRTHSVSLRAWFPISERHRVFCSASIAYLRGGPVRVRRFDLSGDFQGVLADADLNWLATDSLQLFARYQFFDQIADDPTPLSNPSVVRNTAIVGIQFFSQPPDRTLRFREPQRVDRSDTTSPAP
ncbi:hypothetical protein AKJ09_05094 [Labilithrix luteola]|uniref:Uncharacterized protein n=1 Tax=Labilithrix luteola TaxID=1391654 RepID=A0A0K1PY23_9BACT|nr:hypothetical protein AKJ09_05094 [Labilithrix luteola]